MDRSSLSDRNFLNKIAREYKRNGIYSDVKSWNDISVSSPRYLYLDNLYGLRLISPHIRFRFTDFSLEKSSGGDLFICGNVYGYLVANYKNGSLIDYTTYLLKSAMYSAKYLEHSYNSAFADSIERDLPDITMYPGNYLDDPKLDDEIKKSVGYRKAYDRITDVFNHKFNLELHNAVYKGLKSRVNTVPMLYIDKLGYCSYYYAKDTSNTIMSKGAIRRDTLDNIRESSELLGVVVHSSIKCTPYGKWLRIEKEDFERIGCTPKEVGMGYK